MDVLITNKDLFHNLLYYVLQIRKKFPNETYLECEYYYLYDIISKISCLINNDIKLIKFYYEPDSSCDEIINKFKLYLDNIIKTNLGNTDEFNIIKNSYDTYYKTKQFNKHDYNLLT